VVEPRPAWLVALDGALFHHLASMLLGALEGDSYLGVLL
jgi:hypothetical protein